jgi:cell division protein FtsN
MQANDAAVPEAARERFDFYSVPPEAKRKAPVVEHVMVPAAPPQPQQSGRAGRYVLQIEGFSSMEEARAMQDKLAFMRLDSRIQQDAGDGRQPGYRILVGPYTDLNDVVRVEALLSKRGIKTTRERVP